jgi:glycosyltransferase involved in cell wall biosynthesis
MLYALRDDTTIPSKIFDFPAPFIKKIITFLDKKAMENIKSFSAISKTILNRKNYFPSKREVDIIYPPSTLSDLKDGRYDYFFVVSRLDRAKRVDLIIQAYKKANTQIPLKIAGTGELYSELYELSKDDNRIELVGFLSDKELAKYYSNAYAVIFIPIQEDYGLVTIEAMKCSKAVITTIDSGGVLEFVEDNITGVVTTPSITDLTHAIELLSSDRQLTLQMGRQAKEVVKNIRWQNSIDRLIKTPLHITLISTYPIYPPMGGGQNRVYYLYKALAKYYHITIISLLHASEKYSQKEIAPNLREIQIPKSIKHEKAEELIFQKIGIPITDIALIELFHLSTNFINEIKEYAHHSDLVIITSPYTYPILKKLNITKPIIYESQNVEYLLKKEILTPSTLANSLLDSLYQVEKETILNSALVTVCAEEDAKTFYQLYHTHTPMPLIPNGVDIESVNYYSQKRKKLQKERFDYRDKKIAIFMGSAHAPNIDAVSQIILMAERAKEILFIIIGGVFSAFGNREIPPNLQFTGFIDDIDKDKYLSIADIALNPMLSGSGSNLKMLDYLASGIPTITTPIGARGLNLPNRAVVISPIEDFVNYFDHIKYLVDTKMAKRFVFNQYGWKHIAINLKKELLTYESNK